MDNATSQQQQRQKNKRQRKQFKGISFGKIGKTSPRQPRAITPDDWQDLQADLNTLPAENNHQALFTAMPTPAVVDETGYAEQAATIGGADAPAALRIPMAAKWADAWQNPEYHPNSVVGGIAVMGQWLADWMGIEDEDELLLRDELTQPTQFSDEEQALLDSIPDVTPDTLFAVKQQRQQAANSIMQSRFPNTMPTAKTMTPPGLKLVMDRK